MPSVRHTAFAALSLGAAASLAGLALAQSPAARPVAVELFTSQGCSSCPPADTIMARLAADPRVVAITRPVTYWDRLGWKDTLARPENTELQRAYAQRKIPGAGVYTPQSVVQGRSGVVGGRGDQIQKLIGEAQRLPQPALAVAGAGAARAVTIDGTSPAPARVSVVAMRRAVDVAIRGGENGGRRIRYSNVLVNEAPIGRWAGGKARLAIPAATTAVRGADRYAVVVRQGETGPVLAARYL